MTTALAITQDTLEESAARCDRPTMQIVVRGTVHDLESGERQTYSL